MSKSTVSGSYGKYMFSFVKKNFFSTVKKKKNFFFYKTEHFHQQFMNNPVSPHSCQNWVLGVITVFKILAILIGVQYILCVVCICVDPFLTYL